MIDDDQLLALCVWTEARGESDDGKAAVARVVLNRKRLHYQSDGTIPGTVLAYAQFSDFWFAFEHGIYTRVCHSHDDAVARAGLLLSQAVKTKAWVGCRNIADRVQADAYTALNGYAALTDDTVLYLNPAIIRPNHMPAWADPKKQVCQIGAHVFYRR